MVVKKKRHICRILIGLFLFFGQNNSVWAQDSEELIEFPEKEMKIGEILETISDKHNLKFSYLKGLFELNETISLEKNEYSLQEIMANIFENKNLNWTKKGKLLIISRQKSLQKTKNISGYIKDAESGEALFGAHIYDTNSNQGVYSNNYGFFSITTNELTVDLTVSFVGYATKSIAIEKVGSEPMSILLTTANNELSEVVVKAPTRILEKAQMGTLELNTQQIKSIPQIMGEADVLKALQLLPGVQGGTEGSTGIYVRGGGPGQNLILLDGVPVYNANHLFGFFSVFNPDVVQNVTLVKGGFPARYGGRLSSVIDINMKEGNTNKLEAEGALGLVASKLTIQGPILKDKTSFLISARRTYIDLFAQAIASLSGSERLVAYGFWDLNGKISHKFSDKDRIFLSAYSGKDKYRDEVNKKFDRGQEGIEFEDEESGIQWGNLTSTLRWNHIFGPKLFGNVTGTYSRYNFSFFNDLDNLFIQVGNENQSIFKKTKYDSSIRDWGLKTDFDYYPHNNHHFRFGASLTNHFFKPGRSVFSSNTSPIKIFGAPDLSTNEFYAYLEDDFSVSDNISFNLGVHGSGSRADQNTYFSLQPRVTGRIQLNDRYAVKASYTRMTQFIHLLVNSGLGLPTDLWVPVTKNIKPQQAEQFGLGLSALLPNKLEFTFESYYKRMNNLLEYRDGASFVDIDNDWEDVVEIGDGYAYGLEFLLQKKEGKSTGWFSYSWSRAFREFDNINFGQKFPFKYDRKHDVSLFVNHELKKNVDLSLVWVYGSGYPVTLPVSTYANSGGHILGADPSEFSREHTQRNGARTPAQHRLDLSIGFSKKKKWGTRKWVIGLYNAYSRLNPAFIDFENDPEPGQPKKFLKTSLFPIIPSISYQFKLD